MAEGWGAAPLVPEVLPALKSAEDAALDAAELAASLVLPVLHASVREQLGSKHSQWLRRQRLRIPGIITDRSQPRQNQLLIDIDRFELEQLCRKYRRSVGHRVCLMYVEGMAEPIKVIPDEIQRHAVTQELLVANWFIDKVVTIMVELPFSRDMETEADEVGMLMAAKVGHGIRIVLQK